MAGHVRLELRNVVAKYPFGRSRISPGTQANSGHRDYSVFAGRRGRDKEHDSAEEVRGSTGMAYLPFEGILASQTSNRLDNCHGARRTKDSDEQ